MWDPPAARSCAGACRARSVGTRARPSLARFARSGAPRSLARSAARSAVRWRWRAGLHHPGSRSLSPLAARSGEAIVNPCRSVRAPPSWTGRNTPSHIRRHEPLRERAPRCDGRRGDGRAHSLASHPSCCSWRRGVLMACSVAIVGATGLVGRGLGGGGVRYGLAIACAVRSRIGRLGHGY